MDSLLENLTNQSGVLGAMALLAVLAGRYAIPLAREFTSTMQEFTTEVARLRENIEEQSEWLRYFLQRLNGSGRSSCARRADEGVRAP